QSAKAGDKSAVAWLEQQPQSDERQQDAAGNEKVLRVFQSEDQVGRHDRAERKEFHGQALPMRYPASSPAMVAKNAAVRVTRAARWVEGSFRSASNKAADCACDARVVSVSLPMSARNSSNDGNSWRRKSSQWPWWMRNNSTNSNTASSSRRR